VLVFQLPIPLLVASVSWRMKTSGWKQGHRELAMTPAGSHHSLSSLHAADGDNHHHYQQQQQQQARAGNEYGSVTPTRNGQLMHTNRLRTILLSPESASGTVIGFIKRN